MSPKTIRTINKLVSYVTAIPQRTQKTIPTAPRIVAPVVVVIPSHRPDKLTVRLVKNILAFNRDVPLHIIIVNDCAPKESQPYFKDFARLDRKRVTVINTPKNAMKAGAINYGLRYIEEKKIPVEVVFTLDDDVILRRGTIKAMVKHLLRNPMLGAVCSLAQVANKNKNLLTRLQGLEYSQFNIIRIADNGYLNGPLVMHGMATAFRYKAIRQVKGFALNHLVEDYDITVRLKDAGWHVALATTARAYTVVPETIKQLWRQRVRWNTGGVQIVTSRHTIISIFQDLLGHGLFIGMFLLVAISFMFPKTAPSEEIRTALLGISIALFLVSYFFSLNMLQYYPEADLKDVIIRTSVLPELMYALFLTLILIGTYLFCLYIAVKRVVFRRRGNRITPLDRIFNKLGYSQTWGAL